MTTYTIYEHSAEDGSPVELYEMGYSGKQWFFTTHTEPVVFQNRTYKPLPIRRGERSEESDATKANLEITLPRDTQIGALFTITPPSEPITVTIKQYHDLLKFTNPDLQTIVIWKGRITNATWDDKELKLTSESIFSSLLRIGAARKYSRACSHTLYNKGCRVNRENFKVSAIPTTVVGSVVSVAHNQVEGWFAGGYAKYTNEHSGVVEFRSILASTALTVTLGAIPIGLVAGKTEIELYAGCDHTHTTCMNKFGNVENYGGQPYIPIQNPFGGAAIF